MTVTYADDIRPKFRDQDIACMRGRHVLLADSTWMCDPAAGHGFPDHANARRVFGALSRNIGFMPPDGKWSQDWLDTFQAWMDGGFLPASPASNGGSGSSSGTGTGDSPGTGTATGGTPSGANPTTGSHKEGI